LGYLSDDEYDYVAKYAQNLRRSPELFRTKELELERRLRAVVPDREARERLLAMERKKHPRKSDAELIDLVLESIARDNR
jgi:hypothetical protein